MEDIRKTLLDVENQFWQSLVDRDTDKALALLHEPALMVSGHGIVKFDHDRYRRMADRGTMVLTAYKLGNVDVNIFNGATAVLTYEVDQTVANRNTSAQSTEKMFDTSTWIKTAQGWRCIAHTETPRIGPK